MDYIPIKLKLTIDELPNGFAYPISFDKYLLTYPVSHGFELKELDPWGIVADADYNPVISKECNLPLVQFAQAWLEDMIACFVIGCEAEPEVMVINPWALRQVGNGKWENCAQILERFDNFEAWLGLAWLGQI